MSNPKKPFKVICTNCGAEVEKKQKEGSSLNAEQIEIVGQPFYDCAIVYIECECGNEIEL